MNNLARALWYTAPGQAEWRSETLPEPGDGRALVRTLYSGVSRGTESLVSRGLVPPSEYGRMRAPFQAGAFPFPVKYGYAAVGETVSGARVFALHPHQSAFVLPDSWLSPLPPGVTPRRALLAANMETAINGMWDAGALPGMRIAVVGGGVLGCLLAYLSARLPGAVGTLVDLLPERAATAAALGASYTAPGDAPTGCDLVFHTSASPAGLSTALRCAGSEAAIVEMSWYGDQAVAAPLGEAFHSQRLRLVGSQVGQVAPAMRPRWSHADRLALALRLCADPVLDALLEPDCPADEAPARLVAVLRPGSGALCQPIAY
jgi:threonine dehydrogenase-like Zn-dependent dehydrogenase